MRRKSDRVKTPVAASPAKRQSRRSKRSASDAEEKTQNSDNEQSEQNSGSDQDSDHQPIVKGRKKLSRNTKATNEEKPTRARRGRAAKVIETVNEEEEEPQEEATNVKSDKKEEPEQVAEKESVSEDKKAPSPPPSETKSESPAKVSSVSESVATVEEDTEMVSVVADSSADKPAETGGTSVDSKVTEGDHSNGSTETETVQNNDSKETVEEASVVKSKSRDRSTGRRRHRKSSPDTVEAQKPAVDEQENRENSPDNRESRDNRDSRENRESREKSRESRDSREKRDTRDSRERREIRDSRDNRDSRETSKKLKNRFSSSVEPEKETQPDSTTELTSALDEDKIGKDKAPDCNKENSTENRSDEEEPRAEEEDKEKNKPDEKPPAPTEKKQKPVRKRKWLTQKSTEPKPQILAISTDSLKNLISDVKPVPLSDVKLESSPEPEEVEVITKPDANDTSRERSHRKDHRNESRQTEKKHDEKTVSSSRKISIVHEDTTAKVQRPPSPPKYSSSNILFITNLVRPFTVLLLKGLLARTGKIVENGFWIDKIKSKCYVKYETEDEAIETRHALHGVRWPPTNPKCLNVDFGSEKSMDKAIASTSEGPKEGAAAVVREERVSGGWDRFEVEERKESAHTRPMREWDVGKKDELGREREKERERDRGDRNRERERDHVKEPRDNERLERRKRSSDRNKRSLSISPVRKFNKKENEPPIRLLDDLFRKTKSVPCVYWLPLTSEQIALKEEEKRKQLAEQKRRFEQREKERNDRERERERDRERNRDRSSDRRREQSRNKDGDRNDRERDRRRY